MNLYQFLSLLGVGGIITALWKWVYASIKNLRKEGEAQKLGIQALLRAQMISEYNKWSDRRFAPIWARDNFQNMWKQYEALGENGVMNDIYDKFLKLPTEKKDE